MGFKDVLGELTGPVRGSRRRSCTLLVGLAAALTVAASASGQLSGGEKAGASAAVPPGIIEARKFTARYLDRPSKIGISTPIGKPIPSGKEIILISCGVSACDELGKSMSEAGAILGWKVRTIKTKGTPQDLQRAFDEAVRAKPFGVTYQAVPYDVVGRQLKQLRAQGTKIVPCCVFGHSEAYDANFIDYAVHVRYGKLMGASLVAAAGPGASIGYVCVTTITSLNILCNNFKSEVLRLCPDCTPKRLDLTIPQLGKGDAPQLVANWLRKNSDVKRVWFSNDDFTTGLLPALKSAGLRDIKLHGFATSRTTLQMLKDGTMEASFPAPQVETAWFYIDGLARLAAGVPVKPMVAAQGDMPNQIWTGDQSIFNTGAKGSNIPSGVPTKDGFLPIAPESTIRNQFKKLWGK